MASLPKSSSCRSSTTLQPAFSNLPLTSLNLSAHLFHFIFLSLFLFSSSLLSIDLTHSLENLQAPTKQGLLKLEIQLEIHLLSWQGGSFRKNLVLLFQRMHLSRYLSSFKSGIGAFEIEYGQWIEEQERKMCELRNVVQSPMGDIELRMMVEKVLNHYYNLFRMNRDAAKADAFYLVSNKWRT